MPAHKHLYSIILSAMELSCIFVGDFYISETHAHVEVGFCLITRVLMGIKSRLTMGSEPSKFVAAVHIIG